MGLTPLRVMPLKDDLVHNVLLKLCHLGVQSDEGVETRFILLISVDLVPKFIKILHLHCLEELSWCLLALLDHVAVILTQPVCNFLVLQVHLTLMMGEAELLIQGLEVEERHLSVLLILKFVDEVILGLDGLEDIQEESDVGLGLLLANLELPVIEEIR